MSTVEDTVSTWGVQYTGGYHNECGRYHEYTGGCSVHWEFTMMSVGIS